MDETTTPPVSARPFARVVRACAWTAIALGLVVLVGGWIADVRTLRSIVPGAVGMKASTASMSMLAGTALLLLSGPPTRRGRLGIAACCALIVAISAGFLAEYLFGWRLGIDEFPFRDDDGRAAGIANPGRISPTTAVSFVLVATALVLADVRRRWSVAAIVPVGVIAGTCLIGYLYSIPAFYGPTSAAKMAVNTGFAFLVITTGVVLTRPSDRLRNALVRTDPAIVLARRLLPVAFALPTTLGWLRLVGEDAGIYDDRVGTWLLTAATIVSLAVIVAIAALRLQQELRQAERQFTAVFNYAPVGMALLERDGSVVTANAALARLAGCSEEDLRGAPAGALGALLRELASRPGAGRQERALMAADGAELRVAATASLIRAADGATARVVVQIEDVTRQYMMAEALAVSRHTLQQQVVRLQQLDQMKEEFVSLVTHELRTPLTSIAGYLDLLLDEQEFEPLDQDRGHFAEVARRNTQRLVDLVEDLLLVRRLESGREALEAERVDLSELVAQQVESLQPAAAQGDLLLSAAIAPGVAVSGDARRLAQVVDNLLSNAVKYTLPGGTVGVELESEDGAARLTVSDSGIGIPEAERGDLFTPFFRASNAHGSAVAGTGLGLVITRRLVEAHRGTITLEPAVETGTAFTVRLPGLALGLTGLDEWPIPRSWAPLPARRS